MYLLWIGEGASDHYMMEEVRKHVERTFDLPARVWSGPERPSDSFDPARRQHLSTAVLRWLVRLRLPGADKILAITDVDLFIPILTFVFGEAQLDGTAAVVSIARLARNADGSRADRKLLTTRLAKESAHELGHTFGLLHCDDRRCVMARSATLLHVDTKRGELCRDCRLHLVDLQRTAKEIRS